MKELENKRNTIVNAIERYSFMVGEYCVLLEVK